MERMGGRAVGVSIVICGIVATLTFAATMRWSRSQSVIKQDGLAYLLYTRSLVMDFDTDLTDDLRTVDAHFNPSAREAVDRYLRHSPATGRVTLPWPVGISVFQAPFFAVGWGAEYITAQAAGREADDLSPLIQVAFAAGNVLWALLGFWLTVRCCSLVTDRRSGLLATVAVAACGPLVFYTFFHPTMSHAVSFMLAAALCLAWLRRWHGDGPGGARVFLWVGLLFGAMASVRYQSALWAILPAVLVVREGWRFGARAGLLGAVAAALGALPPLAFQAYHLYVNHGLFQATVAGDSVVAAQNEMDLTSPHFFEVLFSCKHGAFYWAPFLAIGFGGLVWAGVRRSRWAWAWLATLLANVYLIGTLGEINWSAAAAFGMRYLVECTPFFAVGTALLIASTARLRPRALPAWWGAAGLFAAFNGLLLVAYTLRTISQEECVTYPEMVGGIGRAVLLLLGKAG